MWNDTIFVMEIIGTVAFAVSGSIIAAGCGLDLFGVLIVGCSTAVSGGIIRDLILGRTPPAIFSDVTLLCIAAAVSLAVFIVFYLNAKKFDLLEKKIESINVLFDAIGLAAFTVIGVEAAAQAGFSHAALLSVSMGVITGVGGGIVRDVFVNKIPYVLKKHIYALASVAGSIAYYYIRNYGSRTAALIVAVPLIIVIRLLAAKYRWKLPRVRKSDDD